MKRPKPKSLPPAVLLLSPWINFLWSVPAVGVWVWEQFWHVGRGEAFSFLVFVKGLALLGAASVVFHLSARAFRGFSFLGLLPLLWLSASSFQWELCAPQAGHQWSWLILFLGMGIFLLILPDGKKLFFLFAPLWGMLSWLAPFSCLLPLVFLSGTSKRLKRPQWLRWGGLAVVVFYFILFQEWKDVRFDWLDAYDLLLTKKFIVFLLLGWLGGAAFPVKGPYRHLIFPLFWLMVGTFFFNMGGGLAATFLIQWVMVFFAGFGWESFRRDLMDPTWHGRLVWLALGLAFLGGVI